MGTLLFIILYFALGHEQPNDYQVVSLLVSLDSVAGLLLVNTLRKSKSA
jgi:hypothetical protein